MSQPGRVGVNFEDAHHEAIGGLKKAEVSQKRSTQVKGKVCALFEDIFFVLKRFKGHAIEKSTFKVSSIVFLPCGTVKVSFRKQY